MARRQTEWRLREGPGRLAIAGLRFYRYAVSPIFPATCRFSPSCSRYAIEAIEGGGLWRGAWLALKRVCRCHPFSAGGFDPPPGKIAP